MHMPSLIYNEPMEKNEHNHRSTGLDLDYLDHSHMNDPSAVIIVYCDMCFPRAWFRQVMYTSEYVDSFLGEKRWDSTWA